MKWVLNKVLELWQDRTARVGFVVAFGFAAAIFGYLFEYENSFVVSGIYFTAFQAFLNVVIAVFFGLNVGLLVQEYKRFRVSGHTVASSFAGLFFGAIATGCPVCGSGLFASLLAFFGVTGSLALFPFKGVELKLVSLVFLVGTFVVKARTTECKIPGAKY